MPMKQSIRRSIAWALLLAAAPAPTLANLTLDDSIDLALRNNPRILAARQKVEVANGRAVQAGLWSNPELELTAEEMPIDSGGLSSSKNLIGVAQTISFPGKKSLDRKIGVADIQTAQSEYISQQLALVRRVKQAFFRTLAAQEKLAVTQQLLTLAESLVETTAKRVKAGAATDQEQLRVEIEQERAAVQHSSQRRELTDAQKQLATLLGQPGEPVPRLHGAWRQPSDFLDMANRGAQSLEQHPVLRMAVNHVERTELELRRAKLEAMPDPTVVVAVGNDEAANETIMDFRVSLPLPLFDRAQGRKRVTHAMVDIARFDVMTIQQQLLEEWSLSASRIAAATEQVEAYRARILPKVEKALQLVQRGYDAGRFDLLDLLDIQRTTAESKIAYYDKLFELHAAAADLESLLPPQDRNTRKGMEE